MDRRTFLKCTFVSFLSALFPVITRRQPSGVIDHPTLFQVGAIPREPKERVEVVALESSSGLVPMIGLQDGEIIPLSEYARMMGIEPHDPYYSFLRDEYAFVLGEQNGR